MVFIEAREGREGGDFGRGNGVCDVGLVVQHFQWWGAARCPGLCSTHKSCEEVNRVVGIYVALSRLS